MTMLRVERVSAGYGPVQVLHGVTLVVTPGEVTCLMGRNGAGKTTLLRTIMGLVKAQSGTITLEGKDIATLPAHEVPRAGIGYVPQGRRLFGEMTVAENLDVGLLTRGRGIGVRDRVLHLFPRLAERMNQQARTLSGGEQQMLAIGRALCLEPSVLLLDEPTEGLQPSMIELIEDTVVLLRKVGVGVLLVEQRVEAALRIADRVAFLSQGRMADIRPARDLTRDSPAFRAHVGV
jgi:branched-chain amino acid transport system ATP-binding protein